MFAKAHVLALVPTETPKFATTLVLGLILAGASLSVIGNVSISHKPAATSGSVMALTDAPKLPIDITEAF